MRETVWTSMRPSFERWCQRLDDVFPTQAQKNEFRHYLGGLLGERREKTYPSSRRTLLLFLNKAYALLQSELAGADKGSTKGEAIGDRVAIRCIPQK